MSTNVEKTKKSLFAGKKEKASKKKPKPEKKVTKVPKEKAVKTKTPKKTSGTCNHIKKYTIIIAIIKQHFMCFVIFFCAILTKIHLFQECFCEFYLLRQIQYLNL